MHAPPPRSLVSGPGPALWVAALALVLSLSPPGLTAQPAAPPAKPQPKPAPPVSPDAPITVSHSGDQEGWHYTTRATVAKDRLDLDETAHRQDAGGMDIAIHATGHLENFRPWVGLQLENGAITRFGYNNKDARGTIDFSWTARKDDPGVGGLQPPQQVLKLPPLAEVPLDIGGFPFTLAIDSSLLIKPAFTGAMESTQGHFTVQYHGDLGILVENGKATPVGSLQLDGQIADDTASITVEPLGFVGAVALPKLELKPGFTPSSLSAANSGLAQLARQLLEQNGQQSDPGPGLGGFTGAGPYVEVITSGGLSDAGHLGILPCQQTTLYLSLKVGDASPALKSGDAGPSEGRSYQLKASSRSVPNIEYCVKGLDLGDSQKPPSASLPPCNLEEIGTDADFLGVPGGRILPGRRFGGAHGHPGTDVGKLRDAPVFANLRATIPLQQLNHVLATLTSLEGTPCAEGQPCWKTAVDQEGLGIAGQGNASLVDAEVVVQKWSPPKELDKAGKLDFSYGGVLGLAAHYQYLDNSGKPKVFTAYIEYLHLITDDYPPRADNGDFIDNQGQKIDAGAYSGCKGFGARMTNGNVLTAVDLALHPLIGYLGATVTPHVHIKAAFSPGRVGAVQRLIFDPAILLAP
jgi:hypothetical protein